MAGKTPMMQWGRDTAPIVLSVAGAVAGIATVAMMVLGVVLWL